MDTRQLTFTRFIAAIGIVFFHLGSGVAPFDTGVLSMLAHNANLAVSYFFCLSGFVMIIAYSKGKAPINVADYYINRFAKIYPVYITALIIMLFYSTEVTPGKLVSEVLLVHSIIPPYAIAYNLPDWSLSVEIFFYLLFPLVFNRLYITKSLKVTGIVILIICIGSQIACYLLVRTLPTNSWMVRNTLFYNPVLHVNGFLAGNLAGLIYLRLVHKKALQTDYALIMFAAIILISFITIPGIKPTLLTLGLNMHNGLLVVIFAPFIVLLALNKGYISKLLALPALVFLGEISYCIYILQIPVQRVFNSLVSFTSPALQFYIYLAALLICSALAYYLIELPGKRILRKHLKNFNKSST